MGFNSGFKRVNLTLTVPICLFNHLKAELSPICHLLALLGARLIFHVSRIRVNEGMAIWWWTKERLALLLRMDPRHIPDDWCLRPQFLLWPPPRHKAILWILAHFVSYRMQQRQLSLTDYIDFMRRARWKSYQETSGMQRVGNYL